MRGIGLKVVRWKGVGHALPGWRRYPLMHAARVVEVPMIYSVECPLHPGHFKRRISRIPSRIRGLHSRRRVHPVRIIGWMREHGTRRELRSRWWSE